MAILGSSLSTADVAIKSGGSDPVKLDELAPPTDVTTLNASTTAHGLMPKGTGSTSTFYRSDMTQAAPAGGAGGDLALSKNILAANFTIPADQSAVVSRKLKLNSGVILTIALGGRLRIL